MSSYKGEIGTHTPTEESLKPMAEAWARSSCPRPQKDPSLPQPWTSSPQNSETIHFTGLNHPVWCAVPAAPADRCDHPCQATCPEQASVSPSVLGVNPGVTSTLCGLAGWGCCGKEGCRQARGNSATGLDHGLHTPRRRPLARCEVASRAPCTSAALAAGCTQRLRLSAQQDLD